MMGASRALLLWAAVLSAPLPGSAVSRDDSCRTAVAVDQGSGVDPAPAQTEADVEQAEQREAEALDVRLLQARLFAKASTQEGVAKAVQPSTVSCAANKACKDLGLEGDCCPNAAGVSLGCCDNFVPPAAPLEAAPPPPPPPPVANYSGPRSCEASPCSDLGLTGNCCPNDGGAMLGCCTALEAAAPVLAPATVPGPLMTFYMYRVQSNENYPLNGVNLANLDGDVWYLHNEVVQHCPRKFNMSRLLRFKVTMRSTAELNGQGHQFDSFVAFDKAKCTVPMCDKLHWNLYGYVVGCQPNFKGQVAVPGDPVWYSLPGTCPSKFYNEKTDACNAAEPGGHCLTSDVSGSRDCTYHLEQAGEISLDELTGMVNYNEKCATTGKKEYDMFTDKGNGTSFWDGKTDAAKGAARVKYIIDLFAKKFPDMPTGLQEPPCDAR